MPSGGVGKKKVNTERCDVYDHDDAYGEVSVCCPCLAGCFRQCYCRIVDHQNRSLAMT